MRSSVIRRPTPTSGSSIGCWLPRTSASAGPGHWMDVARFAESHGYEQDYDRPFAYHYRDFLIRAFNDDMPYDQFVRWQLAGDEWEPDDPLAHGGDRLPRRRRLPDAVDRGRIRVGPVQRARRHGRDDRRRPSSASRSAAPAVTITSMTRSPPTTTTGWPRSSRRRSAARSTCRRRMAWGEAGEGAGHRRGLSAHQAPRRRSRLPALLPEDIRPAPGRRCTESWARRNRASSASSATGRTRRDGVSSLRRRDGRAPATVVRRSVPGSPIPQTGPAGSPRA